MMTIAEAIVTLERRRDFVSTRAAERTVESSGYDRREASALDVALILLEVAWSEEQLARQSRA
jgi:hypothetical protein